MAPFASMLDELRAGWAARGWQTGDLARFRMDGDDPPAPPPPPPPPDPPVTFTQDDLNRIAAKEKAEGERAALGKVAEQLGCTVDEAKKLLDAHREAEKGKMTEAERKLAEAAEKETKAQARETEAALRERRALVRESLAEAGVKGDRRDGAMKLVLVDLADDADETAIKTAVDDAKKAYPEFFATGTPDPTKTKRTPPSGDPKGNPPRRSEGEDTFSKRFEQAAVRAGAKTKEPAA